MLVHIMVLSAAAEPSAAAWGSAAADAAGLRMGVRRCAAETVVGAAAATGDSRACVRLLVVAPTVLLLVLLLLLLNNRGARADAVALVPGRWCVRSVFWCASIICSDC